MSDRTGQPVGDRSGQPSEHRSSEAQIRTLLDDLKEQILAECVKGIPPTTENWLRKRYDYSLNNDTSTEDKHETNHINNKYNDMNMHTRNMHNT